METSRKSNGAKPVLKKIDPVIHFEIAWRRLKKDGKMKEKAKG